MNHVTKGVLRKEICPFRSFGKVVRDVTFNPIAPGAPGGPCQIRKRGKKDFWCAHVMIFAANERILNSDVQPVTLIMFDLPWVQSLLSVFWDNHRWSSRHYITNGPSAQSGANAASHRPNHIHHAWTPDVLSNTCQQWAEGDGSAISPRPQQQAYASVARTRYATFMSKLCSPSPLGLAVVSLCWLQLLQSH